jgi:hypothetical protein
VGEIAEPENNIVAAIIILTGLPNPRHKEAIVSACINLFGKQAQERNALRSSPEQVRSMVSAIVKAKMPVVSNGRPRINETRLRKEIHRVSPRQQTLEKQSVGGCHTACISLDKTGSSDFQTL